MHTVGPLEDTARRHWPQAKERGLRRNQTCRHLDLGLPVSRTVKNKFLLFKPSNLWYFSYSPRKLTYVPKNCCLSASTSLPWILFKIYIYIFKFLTVLGLCCCVVSGSYSLVAVCGFSLTWLLLWSTGPRAGGRKRLWRVGSVIVAPSLQGTGLIAVAHGLSCSVGCDIFPDQGSNTCFLNWQEDSLPVSHQGSPMWTLLERIAVHHSMKLAKCLAYIKKCLLNEWVKEFPDSEILSWASNHWLSHFFIFINLLHSTTLNKCLGFARKSSTLSHLFSLQRCHADISHIWTTPPTLDIHREVWCCGFSSWQHAQPKDTSLYEYK